MSNGVWRFKHQIVNKKRESIFIFCYAGLQTLLHLLTSRSLP